MRSATKFHLGPEDSHAYMVDGYDDCIVGYWDDEDRFVYSKEKMIKKWLEVYNESKEGDEITAVEYLEFNIWYVYVGPTTPIFVFSEDYFELDGKNK